MRQVSPTDEPRMTASHCVTQHPRLHQASDRTSIVLTTRMYRQFCACRLKG